MRMKSISVFLFFALSASLACAQEGAPDFTVKKLGEGVYAAITRDGGKSGSNAGFIIGDDGIAVVDTFVDIAPAQQLLAEILKVSNLPIRFVINTHYHLDHTGGNKVFANAGATIIAHQNLRAWVHTENMKFLGTNPKPESKARVEALALPSLVYKDAVDVYLGNRLLTVRFMPGHTGGDSVVFVPDANVFFAGDLFWKSHLPNLIDASTAPWIETLETIMAEHPAATFVPGHGDVGRLADVRDFHDYLVTLRQDVKDAQASGKTGDDMVTAVTPQLQGKYGSWGFFNNFVKRNIEQTDAELVGKKKLPAPIAQAN
jgi:cyclase